MPVNSFDFEIGEDGKHEDDDGERCDCTERECDYGQDTPEGTMVLCPNCGSDEHELVCGDHGCKCDKCDTRFTVP